MSPLARELLSAPPAPWTFADKTDFIVAVGAVAGLIFLGGFSLSEQRHEARAKACATHLPDGRALTAYHMTADGPERCVYAQPAATRKPRRG